MTDSQDSGLASTIPGYRVGEWEIDPSHSDVSFSVRHTVVWLRGRFLDVTGKITTTEDPLQSRVEAVIKAASFTTNYEKRDFKIRTYEDFLWSEKFPLITYRSTGLRSLGDGRNFEIDGQLAVRSNTRNLTMPLQLNGVARHKLYGTRVGFAAQTTLDWRELANFDLSRTSKVESSVPLSDNNNMLGHTLNVSLQIEAVLTTDRGEYTW